LKQLNLDGSHAIAKKGGQALAYQGRKKAKTSNILPITDGRGYILASTGIVAGNHNDAYLLKAHLQTAFKTMKAWGLPIAGAFFNADSAFDTLDTRKACFNHHLIPTSQNIFVTVRPPSPCSMLKCINVGSLLSG